MRKKEKPVDIGQKEVRGNTTRCCVCGKEIILPDGINTIHEKAEEAEEYPFCLPGDNADITKELAYCDPCIGGYYCYACGFEEHKKASEAYELDRREGEPCEPDC